VGRGAQGPYHSTRAREFSLELSPRASDNARPHMDEVPQEIEGWFRAMADSAPMPMWLTGPDGRCTFVNACWLRFTGRTLAEQLGDGWVSSLHPDDRPSCLAQFLAATAERRAFELEYRLRRHDGEYRWMVDSGVPRLLPDGRFVGHIGWCTDTSARRWAQDELARVDAQLQAVLDASQQVAIVAMDAAGEVTLWSRGAERIFGRRAADAVGRSYAALMVDSAELAERRARLSAEVGRPVDDVETLTLRARMYDHDEREWTIYRPDGARRVVDLVTSPMRGRDGELTGFTAIARDVTDAKAAEVATRESAERLQGALHGSMDAIQMLVAIRDERGALIDLMFTDLNPRAEALLGRPAGEVVGARLSELYPTAGLPAFVARLGRVIDTGEPFEDEFEVDRAALPGAAWLRMQVTRLGDGVVVTARDISQRKRDEEQLRLSEARLSMALAAAQDGLWDWDIARGEVYLSPQWLAHMSYDPGRSTVPVAEISARTHPDDLPGARAATREHLGGHTLVYGSATPTAGGRGCWCVGRWSRATTPGGRCACSGPPATSPRASARRPSCGGRRRTPSGRTGPRASSSPTSATRSARR
jgi:PAS domain S-box-containing protein